MVLRDQEVWSPWPPVSPQSPVLALLATANGLWAGGIGEIALKAPERDWVLCASTHAIRMVLALAEAGSSVFAAGAGGIARSLDRGKTWVRGQGTALYTILCIEISPEYGRDSTVLAGTLDGGVLRSADGGATWTSSQFGMHASEVSDLVWIDGQTVLASTPEGLYRSTTGGRSWRNLGGQVYALLRHRAEVLVAIAEDGVVLRSGNSGELWQALGSLPLGVLPQALEILPDGGLLVGSDAHGVFHSSDGAVWEPCGNHQVLSLVTAESSVCAGTEMGVIEFGGIGQPWQDLGSPQLFDYSRVSVTNDEIVISGVLSPPQRWRDSEGWSTLTTWPSPVQAFAHGWDVGLLVATPQGVFFSDSGGESWQQRSSLPGGDFFALRTDGVGWMATADGGSLSITRDRGDTWSALRPPFGVLPVVALQTTLRPDNALLIAVTFDAAQQAATLWRSIDEGESWERGNEAATSWPIVATLENPLAVSIGSAIILRGPDGIWMRTQPGGGNVRKMKTSAVGIVVLTQDGLWLKPTDGEAWLEVELPGACDRIVDIDLDGETLAVLLTGGEVHMQKVDTQ